MNAFDLSLESDIHDDYLALSTVKLIGVIGDLKGVDVADYKNQKIESILITEQARQK